MPRSTHTGSVCLPPVASQPRFIDQTVEQCAKGAVSCPLATTADRLPLGTHTRTHSLVDKPQR